MRLIDTHAHLSDRRYDADLTEVLERARQSGVTAMVVVGYDLATSRKAVQLAHQYPQIWASVGLHPHHARDFDQVTLQELDQLARDWRVVAIGECGLDFFRNLSSASAQREAFEAQLQLAEARQLPVVVHSRDAMDETLAVLAGHSLKSGGVLHCFDGTATDAQRAVACGLHISCAGILTYRKVETLAHALASVPEDRLVVETDCPYLSPAGHRGERNEPAYVRIVAEALARVRQQPMEQIAEQTTANAAALFNTPSLSGVIQEHAA
ncbi:MAG TPA: TatD family hydrolase [Chloroflexota bacterium]|nr:TatD family hydrolase [Chloroflexota bacterium]